MPVELDGEFAVAKAEQSVAIAVAVSVTVKVTVCFEELMTGAVTVTVTGFARLLDAAGATEEAEAAVKNIPGETGSLGAVVDCVEALPVAEASPEAGLKRNLLTIWEETPAKFKS